MLEFHFLHMDAHDARRIIPLHHHSEIGLVVKIGRTVYVIHFRSGRLPCYRIAVHLARMGHEHYQAVVSGGKAGAIPFILLLDPQGRIVAKELRGKDIYEVAIESMNK